jgi:hypothetical protein
MSGKHSIRSIVGAIRRSGMVVAVSTLAFTVVACSGATGYQLTPEGMLNLLLTMPPVPVPPVTPLNESTPDLENAIGMGQGHVDIELYAFRSFITKLLDAEARPLWNRHGYQWRHEDGTVIDLQAWVDDGTRFEMEYDSTIPENFVYPTTGRFSPNWSDGELHHQALDLAWSTGKDGTRLDMDGVFGTFASFDSTNGGGWVHLLKGDPFGSGHEARWDRYGNIMISYWF